MLETINCEVLVLQAERLLFSGENVVFERGKAKNVTIVTTIG